MKLKKENHINKNSNFLDLNINIQNSRFQTMFYDKRDNFNFNIIRCFINQTIQTQDNYSKIIQKYSEYAKQKLVFRTLQNINWKSHEAKGLINRVKKAPLKL